MRTPIITKLNETERKVVMDEISKLPKLSQEVTVDAIEFIDYLSKELQSAKINVHILKKMFGFRSEKLKKLFQVQ